MVRTVAALIDAAAPKLPPETCSVEVVTDEGAFFGLEALWNEAVDRAGVAYPFLRHEWLRTWWECFGAGARLHLIIVRAGGRIAAIAPLMWETVRMYGMPVRRLRLLHNDHTPRADFIIAERPEQSYAAIWTALRQASDVWDVLQLGQLPRQSTTRAVLSGLAAADRCHTGLWHSGDAPYLELTGDFERYFNGRTAKFRQNIRNRLSRLSRLGPLALETLSDTSPILRARDDAFRLEASGWKYRAGTAVCSDPAVHRFYTLLAERASVRGWLRLLFLSVEGRRIAVSYGSQYANRLFLFKTGYDPDYAQCSPFKLLTYFALADAFAQGLSEVDFLGDTEPWKLEWTTTTRPHDWLFVFGNTSRARLVYRAKFQVAPALKPWRG
jgi:CelD/BcsL family acetyltransferase involved in cellulose biosynthesis